MAFLFYFLIPLLCIYFIVYQRRINKTLENKIAGLIITVQTLKHQIDKNRETARTPEAEGPAHRYDPETKPEPTDTVSPALSPSEPTENDAFEISDETMHAIVEEHAIKNEPLSGAKPDTITPHESRQPPTDTTADTKKTEPGLSEMWQKTLASYHLDWELFTGTRLFAWLAGIALFIAAGFFVNYTIEEGIFTVKMRLSAGALLGLGLLVGSGRFKESHYSIMRQTLASCGIGVLYAIIFAATIYFREIPAAIGFAMVCLITITAFILSVYYQAISISIMGAVGGYLTPILINTGSGNLIQLLLYIAIVNTGLVIIDKRLHSPLLLFTAALGSFITLSLATISVLPKTSHDIIAGVWIANTALFSAFFRRSESTPKTSGLMDFNGIITYAPLLLLTVILTIDKPGWFPLLVLTASSVTGISLAATKPAWVSRFIQYSALSLIPAIIWTFMRFSPNEFSINEVLFLVYGVAGCFGPVFLIYKNGLTPAIEKWLKIFPVTAAILGLCGLIKNPSGAVFFWPLMLCFELGAIFVSILTRAFIQVIVLVIIFIVGGILWVLNIPALMIGPLFFGFILLAGVILCSLIIFIIHKLPLILKAFNLPSPEKPQKAMIALPEQWLSSTPVLGAFMLLGVSFMINYQGHPHHGMATMICFLAIAFFTGKRADFHPPVVLSLVAAIAAQAVWVFNPDISSQTLYSAVIWSSALFLPAVILPFVYYPDPKRWKNIWNGFAFFEVCQGLFLLLSAYQLWGNTVAYIKLIPLVFAMIKLPAVWMLLKQTKNTTHRNSILAFHGGVLLFYISLLPLLLLDHGWTGLTFVIEAAGLLWLNKRIEHPGLRWTALLMAPAGFITLFLSIPDLNHPEAFGINPALIATGIAVAALFTAVRHSGYPSPCLRKIPVKNSFLWMALGSSFYLLNLVVADLFSGKGALIFPLTTYTVNQYITAAMGWALYGGIILLWPKSLDRPFRMTGLILICIAVCKAVAFPFIFSATFATMPPVLNAPTAMFCFFIAGLLWLTIKKESHSWPVNIPSQPFWGIILGLFSFCILNIELASILGDNMSGFTLRTHDNFAMQLGYSIGWLCYALLLLSVGVKWKIVILRQVSIVLLALTAIKIFIKDLWSLGSLYRIGSFTGLAVILLLVSYIYQRFLSEDTSDQKKNDND